MKKLVAIGALCIAVMLIIAASAQAATLQPFYLKKVCADPDPSVCRIQNAQPVELFGCLNGGVVKYLGPNLGKENPHGFVHLSSEVVLTGTGCSVTGHFRWVGDHGYFTLRRGTGALVGLHAEGDIEWLEGATFTLTGTYHFAPQ